MTTTTDATSASAIYSQYALASDTSSSTSSTDTLGKDTFLQLLVTQLQNQNPLDPQDNSEFVAQLAQFSSLESMQTLNDTVDTLLGNYTSTQALQASSLVGRSVITEADTATVAAGTGLTGQIDVTSSTTGLTVNVYDADGNVVKNIDLGSQSAGTVSFTWDGTDNDGLAVDAGTYTFEAKATVDGEEVAQTTYLPSVVNSVTVGSTAGSYTLNLASGESIALSDVKTIGS
ncbi:flagellar hook assembly protein FlgD [Pseudomonas putida]|uniref:Basal-body rod modification protein FlgD n=1 Tax=Pseudomonas putida TaxID=303 RepID=A0A4D6XG10_PSEPU|nr:MULTISPECIES: flagellar hook assembly protein FlgD [Pseudomonas]MBK5000668.1 flagellar hook assembly protein FlgD [Pseudomonas sp. S31]QCI13830.1 flagellar hook assembly protein FlgD [Pseudomonas putida]